MAQSCLSSQPRTSSRTLSALPVASITCMTAPTPTLRPPAGQRSYWRLVSHLSLNHLSLADSDNGADGLREILRLYDFRDSPETRAIIDSILSIKSKMGKEVRLPIGNRQFSPQEVSAVILRTLKERAEKQLGHPVGKAVITVPAFFNDNQRTATREAGELAGLDLPENLEGTSFVPLLGNPGQPWKKGALTVFGSGNYNSIRSKRYRYTEWQHQGNLIKELYDLEADPWETINLADRSEVDPVNPLLSPLPYKPI